jgi:flagellar basal-body rod protein FlgB
MITNMTSDLDFQAKALVLRAERQRVIASNIANADTPGYVARDLNFCRPPAPTAVPACAPAAATLKAAPPMA